MRAKPTFFRYHDLDRVALNVEYQIHTTQTDGEATVRDILAVARDKGLGAIAFTEHVRKDTSWFPQFVEEISRARHDFPDLTIYVGCETKALDWQGSLDVSAAVLDACEVVLGSVHRFPDGNGGYSDFAVLTPGETAQIEFELSLGMLKHAPIDVLAHPGGMYQRRFGTFPEHYFRELMLASLERNIAIEINSSYLADVEAFLRLCDEINPYISIGSDAHKLEELGRCRDMLRELGVPKS
jgi:putative hydrolase